jgi:hypothetical protein
MKHQKKPTVPPPGGGQRKNSHDSSQKGISQPPPNVSSQAAHAATQSPPPLLPKEPQLPSTSSFPELPISRDSSPLMSEVSPSNSESRALNRLSMGSLDGLRIPPPPPPSIRSMPPVPNLPNVSVSNATLTRQARVAKSEAEEAKTISLHLEAERDMLREEVSAAKAYAAILLTTKSELEEKLVHSIESLKLKSLQLDEAQHRNESFEQLLQSLQADMISAKEAAREHEDREIQALTLKYQDDLQSLESRFVSELKSERENHEQEMTTLRSAVGETASTLAEQVSVLSRQHESNLLALRTELELKSTNELQSLHRDYQSQLKEANATLESSSNERTHLLLSLNQTKTALDSTNNNLQMLVEQNALLKNQIHQTSVDLEKAVDDLKKSKSESSSFQVQLEEAAIEKKKLIAKIYELESNMSAVSLDKEKLSKDLISNEQSLQKTRSEKDEEINAMKTQFSSLEQGAERLLNENSQLRSDLDAAKSLINDLSDQIDTLKQKEDDLRSNFERTRQEEMENVESMFASKLIELETSIRSSMTAERENAMQALRGEYESKMQDMSELFDQRLHHEQTSHLLQLESLRNTIHEAAAINDSQVSEAISRARLHEQQEFEKLLLKVQAEHSAELVRIRALHGEELGRITSSHFDELQNMKQEANENLSTALEKQRESISAELISKHKAEVELLKSEHQEAIGELVRNHAELIESLQTKHSEDLSNLSRSHEIVLDDLKKRHLEELQQTTSKYEISVAQLNQLIEDMNSSSQATIQRLQDEIFSIREGRELEIASIEMKYSTMIDELNAKHRSLVSDHETNMTALEIAHADEKKKFETEVSTLQSALETSLEQLEKAQILISSSLFQSATLDKSTAPQNNLPSSKGSVSNSLVIAMERQSLLQEVSVLKSQYNQQQQKQNEMELELSQLKSEFESSKSSWNSEKQGLVEKFETEKSHLLEQSKQLQQVIESKHTENEKLLKLNSQFHDEKSQFESTIQQLKQESNSLRSNLSSAEAAHAKSIDTHKSLLAEVNTNVEALQNALTLLQSRKSVEVVSFQERESTYLAKISSLEQSQGHFKTIITSYLKDFSKLSVELESMELMLSSPSSGNEVSTKPTSFESQTDLSSYNHHVFESLSAQMSSLNRRIIASNESVSSLRNQLKSLVVNVAEKESKNRLEDVKIKRMNLVSLEQASDIKKLESLLMQAEEKNALLESKAVVAVEEMKNARKLADAATEKAKAAQEMMLEAQRAQQLAIQQVAEANEKSKQVAVAAEEDVSAAKSAIAIAQAQVAASASDAYRQKQFAESSEKASFEANIAAENARKRAEEATIELEKQIAIVKAAEEREFAAWKEAEMAKNEAVACREEAETCMREAAGLRAQLSAVTKQLNECKQQLQRAREEISFASGYFASSGFAREQQQQQQQQTMSGDNSRKETVTRENEMPAPTSATANAIPERGPRPNLLGDTQPDLSNDWDDASNAFSSVFDTQGDVYPSDSVSQAPEFIQRTTSSRQPISSLRQIPESSEVSSSSYSGIENTVIHRQPTLNFRSTLRDILGVNVSTNSQAPTSSLKPARMVNSPKEVPEPSSTGSTPQKYTQSVTLLPGLDTMASAAAAATAAAAKVVRAAAASFDSSPAAVKERVYGKGVKKLDPRASVSNLYYTSAGSRATENELQLTTGNSSTANLSSTPAHLRSPSARFLDIGNQRSSRNLSTPITPRSSSQLSSRTLTAPRR